MNRYPLEPLAQAMGITLGRPGHPADSDRADTGLAAIADRLGISLPTAHRRRRHGIPWHEADRYAVAIGHLPGTIWPSWYDDAPPEGDDWYSDDPSLEQLDPVGSAA